MQPVIMNVSVGMDESTPASAMPNVASLPLLPPLLPRLRRLPLLLAALPSPLVTKPIESETQAGKMQGRPEDLPRLFMETHVCHEPAVSLHMPAVPLPLLMQS
jgi:hypothetical protein